MSDAKFYEDLAQFMTDSMMKNGFIDAEEVATKVREHDFHNSEYMGFKIIEDKSLEDDEFYIFQKKERAKVKAECIEAAKSCRREVYSRAGVHKCYDMDISFNQLIKALEEV